MAVFGGRPTSETSVVAGGSRPAAEATKPVFVAADRSLWVEPTVIQRGLLDELVGQVARAAVVQAAATVGLAAAFWNSPHRTAVVVAGLGAATGSAFALGARRFRIVENLAARRLAAASIATMACGWLVGIAWAIALALSLSDADAGRRSVALAIAAVLLAEGQKFSVERFFVIAYVAPITLGAVIGLAAIGGGWSLAFAVAAICYGLFVVAQSTQEAAFAKRWIETNVTAAAQGETIRTLLLDFDDEASDWLWRTDADGRVAYVSDGFEAAAADAEEVIDRPFSALFAGHGSRPSDGARSLLAVIAAKKPFRNRLVEISGEDHSRWWRLSGEPLYEANGGFTGYRGVGTDVSGARNSESKIAYLANFDPLTGLANRTNFQALAARQCAAAATDGQLRALLCLDLDGFKSVNDTLGHEGGDELLEQVAARLTAAVATGTVLARIGGDEFAVWVPSTTPARIEGVAKGLIEALRAPFEINGLHVEIGCSIGIALTPKHGIDADNLLMKADLALYRAKSEGRGCAKLFEEAFETSLIERRKLERDIKLALKRREFTIDYQPLVDAHDGRVVCFEALIRWISPERGTVSPVDFIPVAETAGLICAVGRFVLSEACRAAATWPQDVQLAVNLSPPHVRSSDFLQDVTLALKESGLHPSRLQIEVTEGVFLGQSDAASNALKTLRARGVKIVLDDFGTGYSSLNYLVDFPVDKIKIDRAFIRELAHSDPHQAIVDAMLGLARRLNIRVTGEGVETTEQAMALKRRRCDDLQGFLFSRPRPAADVPDMIAEVPGLFQHAIPSHLASPLAMALATRKADGGQAAWL